MTYFSKKYLLLFFILWSHVSLLNLFYVGSKGAVFLWQENSEPKTLAVHFFIALICTLVFIFLEYVTKHLANKKLNMGNTVWALCSVVMVGLIGLLLI
jgi:hypothetical protein